MPELEVVTWKTSAHSLQIGKVMACVCLPVSSIIWGSIHILRKHIFRLVWPPPSIFDQKCSIESKHKLQFFYPFPPNVSINAVLKIIKIFNFLTHPPPCPPCYKCLRNKWIVPEHARAPLWSHTGSPWSSEGHMSNLICYPFFWADPKTNCKWPMSIYIIWKKKWNGGFVLIYY